MTAGVAFWILMLIWLVAGGIGVARGGRWSWREIASGDLLLFLAIFLLGWRVFGAPIQ